MDDGPLPTAADFVADTAVERVGPGVYRCELSGRWNAALHPFGGVATALALRAMQDDLAHPDQRLRTATTVYVSPVPVGPLEIRVERLRAGRTGSQLQASVRSAGATEGGLVQLAVYGQEREGFAFTDAVAPEAPPPERCPGLSEPPPGFAGWRSTFFEQMEMRHVRMHAPWETGWEAGRAEAVRWMRFRRTPRTPDGSLDPLALVALSDTMPPAIGQRLGPGAPFFFAPSCDLTAHVFATTREEWLLLRARCRLAGEGYASGECEIWSRDGRLLVYATQLMYLRLGALPG
jgi:acyl-CoA thioesterase